jgi:hypothetical protein
MANIKLIISTGKDNTRESIHPEHSLPHFQRVFGQDLIDYFLIDDKGNRIDTPLIPLETKRQKAFRIMKEEAKRLNIDGYEAMNESDLLLAIQNKSNSSNQTSDNGEKPKRKVKKRKQNAKI